eukprot:273837_1
MADLEEISDDQLQEIGLKMAHRLRISKGIRAFFTAEEHKENDVARICKNPLIICLGIAEYDELENLDTANDIAMYLALFEGKYHYKVVANDPSQRMTHEDVKQFLRKARKQHLYDFDADKLHYDGLIVTYGGHGTYDSIMCSDGTPYKHKDLRKIFFLDEFTDIPKIFLIDACRMDDDVESSKARKSHTASTFSTTLMTSEGNTVYGAQICEFITKRLSGAYAYKEYADFRSVYLTAKKRIREATMGDQDLQLCEHDTDIDFVVFKPKHAQAPRGTGAKRYYGDSKQRSTANFMRTFLKKIGMDRYYGDFEAKGLLDEASLKSVNEQTLISLGIRNKSSHKAIMKAIKNIK